MTRVRTLLGWGEMVVTTGASLLIMGVVCGIAECVALSMVGGAATATEVSMGAPERSWVQVSMERSVTWDREEGGEGGCER